MTSARMAHRTNGWTKRRSSRASSRIFAALSAVFLVVGFAIIASPFVLRAISASRQQQTVRQSEQTVAGWPYPKAEEAIKAARAYNRRLAASGQTTIGEVADPFASDAGASSASDAGTSMAANDREYQSLLDTGQGVMGSIRIPEIGVNLPIYHGASDDALAAGAGHLYGTSLPVGGAGTHAVITGHRGLPGSLLFTRLDELREGDAFYIDVMGKTLGYKIDRISVIEPNDASALRITPGQDRVTLMTCTPYGVNSHRLLVSGVRASIPGEVPEPNSIHAFDTTLAALVGLGTAFTVVVTCVAVGWRRRRKAAVGGGRGRDRRRRE
ncbi:class C sortase [Bifidobacterium leontopitheci]|uniref:Sortase n=1 Tax=Bifidobacterium leontopitheci TaxID=2650774 RepID=A0A6I1GBM5_9BIFI|nr:class C sortase [Bifidobacterium leontopitheci]KAB7788975.1 sortase [Bifidobacterium leontopitheci]